MNYRTILYIIIFIMITIWLFFDNLSEPYNTLHTIILGFSLFIIIITKKWENE